MTKVGARNDGIGHPGLDPGSHQKCAKKLVLHIRLCFFMSECAFEAFLHSRPIHSSGQMGLRVEPAMTKGQARNDGIGRARNDEGSGPAMTKGQARNDGIGHPGPDPGSNSSVWTDESRMSMTGEAFLSRPHCSDSLRSSVCTDEYQCLRFRISGLRLKDD